METTAEYQKSVTADWASIYREPARKKRLFYSKIVGIAFSVTPYRKSRLKNFAESTSDLKAVMNRVKWFGKIAAKQRERLF